MTLIELYYDSTEHREVRDDLVYALELVPAKKVAIDIGCGSGADIAFLRKNDFVVHAFDIEEDAIERCTRRFGGDPDVHLTLAGFNGFDYPVATLAVADASLFFCAEKDFKFVWEKISGSLKSGGVFCGSFLGPNDTMASPQYDREAFWPDVLIFTEQKVRNLFAEFKIVKWREHNIAGESLQGTPHQWHIYALVAIKI